MFSEFTRCNALLRFGEARLPAEAGIGDEALSLLSLPPASADLQSALHS